MDEEITWRPINYLVANVAYGLSKIAFDIFQREDLTQNQRL